MLRDTALSSTQRIASILNDTILRTTSRGYGHAFRMLGLGWLIRCLAHVPNVPLGLSQSPRTSIEKNLHRGCVWCAYLIRGPRLDSLRSAASLTQIRIVIIRLYSKFSQLSLLVFHRSACLNMYKQMDKGIAHLFLKHLTIVFAGLHLASCHIGSSAAFFTWNQSNQALPWLAPPRLRYWPSGACVVSIALKKAVEVLPLLESATVCASWIPGPVNPTLRSRQP